MYLVFNNKTEEKIPITNYCKHYLIKKIDHTDVVTVLEVVNKNVEDLQTVIQLMRPYLSTHISNLKLFNERDELIIEETGNIQFDDLSENYDAETRYELRAVLDVL